MGRRERIHLLVCVAAVLCLAFLAPAHSRADDNVEQKLRNDYVGKTYVLRNFYSGKKLIYDSAGRLSGSAVSGDWTTDGVLRVDKVSVSRDVVTIHAKRLRLMAKEGFRLSRSETSSLRIEMQLDSQGSVADKADAVLAQVFLTQRDHFVELVPDYWMPCVLAGITGKSAKHYPGCRLSSELLAVPGVASLPERVPDPAEPTDSGGLEARRKGKSNMIPPKPIHSPDPEFPEEARKARYGGTLALSIVVDKTGDVRDVHIVSPMGFGLDQRAVETVRQWRFIPANKDGEPIDKDNDGRDRFPPLLVDRRKPKT